MFQVFHAHGCGPQIYCSFQNGICYEFVRGTVLVDELLRQPSIYRSLPEELSDFYVRLLFECAEHVQHVLLWECPCSHSHSYTT